MLRRRGHEEQRLNVGAYLLGALPEAEARAFERHVAGCRSCREELDDLRVAVDALPQSVEPLEPPPDLKRSIMRQVEAEASSRGAGQGEGARVGGLEGRPRPAAAPPEGGRPREAPAAGEPRPGPEPAGGRGARAGETGRAERGAGPGAGGILGRLAGARARLPRPALAGAAAALALAMVGAYGLGRAVEDGESGPRPGRTITATVDHERVPGARAELVVPSAPGAPAVLRARRLALPEDRVYEIWVRSGERVLPAQVFTVRADGSAEAAIERKLTGADAVLVTRERPGGARRPSEPPVLAVEL